MSDLKSGLILEEGESLVMEIEAELWATSSNPLAIALGKIQKFFAKILGYRVNGFLVITNKRVVEVKKVIECYVLYHVKILPKKFCESSKKSYRKVDSQRLC